MDPHVRLRDPGSTHAHPRDPRHPQDITVTDPRHTRCVPTAWPFTALDTLTAAPSFLCLPGLPFLHTRPRGWSWCTTRVHRAHPLVALGVFATVLFLLLPGAISQQQSPLRGQGIDPVTANATQTAVPVYLSIVLQRVTSINERLYNYEALLDVYMSWVDPRVTIGKQPVLKGVDDAIRSWTSVSNACANATTPRALQACQKAANAWYKSTINLPSCQRPCSPQDPLVCCDAVWLPNLDLPTNLAYSQDRYVKEEIDDLDYPNGMMRVVRVQGTFSNVFDFSRFPFDSQVLELPLVSLGDPEHYYLEPSFVGRNTPGYLTPMDSPSDPKNVQSSTEGSGSESESGSRSGTGSGGGASSQEITGWTISGVSLRCIPDRDKYTFLNKTLLKWQVANKGDPLFQTFAASDSPELFLPQPSNPQNRTTVCTLSINVDRISSYYIWMNVVPVVLTTAIAFSVLVTAPTAIDVRLSVVVTLFLALVAVQFIIVAQVPKTEYITVFGAMILTSYAVFFALIVEAVVVYYVSSVRVFHLYRTGARKKREEEEEAEMEVFSMNGRDPAGLDRLTNTLTRMVSNRSNQRTMQGERENPSQGVSEAHPENNGQHLESQEEGIDGQDPDASTARKGKKGSGSWNLWGPFAAWYHRLANDHFEGYRVACWIDWICGPLLILGYITAMIVICVQD